MLERTRLAMHRATDGVAHACLKVAIDGPGMAGAAGVIGKRRTENRKSDYLADDRKNDPNAEHRPRVGHQRPVWRPGPERSRLVPLQPLKLPHFAFGRGKLAKGPVDERELVSCNLVIRRDSHGSFQVRPRLSRLLELAQNTPQADSVPSRTRGGGTPLARIARSLLRAASACGELLQARRPPERSTDRFSAPACRPPSHRPRSRPPLHSTEWPGRCCSEPRAGRDALQAPSGTRLSPAHDCPSFLERPRTPDAPRRNPARQPRGAASRRLPCQRGSGLCDRAPPGHRGKSSLNSATIRPASWLRPSATHVLCSSKPISLRSSSFPGSENAASSPGSASE